MPITIKVNTNGPLFISAADAASIILTDSEGTVIPLPEGKNVALCRCGNQARCRNAAIGGKACFAVKLIPAFVG